MSSKSQSQPDKPAKQESSAESKLSVQRRHVLTVAAGVTAAVGIAGSAYPFLASLKPSARAKAEGGPVTVDIDKIDPGQQKTVIWRGKPVWILHRTAEEIRELADKTLLSALRDPDSNESSQPAFAHNATRSLKPEYFVCVATCTHLGCIPLLQTNHPQDILSGDLTAAYLCPCHGSKFDLAGRVFKDVPAPKNLVVPPYRYAATGKLVVGDTVK